MAQKNKKSTSKKPTLKDQIKTLNDDLESEKDKYLRLFAEFENFSNGLSKIEISAGTMFDAEKHEAITQIKAPSKKMVGKIIDVVENGYLIGDKILRYPKVVVGN